MKTIFPRIFCIVVLSIFMIFEVKSQDKLSQTLASIKAKVQDVQIDKTTYKQSIDVLDENKGKLSFVSEIADDKGKTAKESFEFFLADIDKNTIVRKTSGKKLFISLSINNNEKFIKHYSEDKFDGYISDFEILLSNADVAGDLVDLFKTAIPLARSEEITWNTNTDALNWLKNNISDINSGSATIKQSFTFGEDKEYLVSFFRKETDQKGGSVDENYAFNILDVDRKKLTLKVRGTQLLVEVETSSNNRYIKCTKTNEQQSFDDGFEIIADGIEQARNIISALSAAIEKSKSAAPDIGSLEKSLEFITKNTSDLTLGKSTVNQKINFIPGNGTKSVFTFAESDSKGKSVEERFEFYLYDLDPNSVNFKVSSDRITISAIAKDKTKLIRYFKDNTIQNFQNEVDILTSDIEISRNLVAALKEAIKNSVVQPVIWKNTDDAVAYLNSALKGETIGTDIFKLDFSSLSADPLQVRYVQDRTDAKKVTLEQSFEFYPYMLDPNTIKITSSGKYLDIEASITGKKSFIKVFKDGKQQSFDQDIELMAFESNQARGIAEALKYLVVNSKPKEMKWNDKQSAINFIKENVVDLKSEDTEVKQKIESTNDDPCKISLTVSTSDNKGKTTEEIYEFSLSDINKQLVDYKVAGKNISVTLGCNNKDKLVKVYKNGVQQSWGTSVEVNLDDVGKAKNVSEAFRSAIIQCEK